MTDNLTEILIVEDSITQAEQLKNTLEKWGYKVIVAYNGEEALERAKESFPTLIISDIVMPKLNGFDLCKKIKSDERLRDIPIVLLTALSDSEDIINGLDAGADNFISKPYSEKYLLIRLNSLLANQSLKKSEKLHLAMEVYFGGKYYTINSEKRQILDLLISTFDNAVQQNKELIKSKNETEALNEQLKEMTVDLIQSNEKLKNEIEYRKKTEKELNKVNSELNNFATIASHDLKEPLRMISSYSRLLEKRYKDKLDESGQEFLHFITDGAARMNSLIEQLLFYSQIGVNNKFDNISLNKVLDSVLLNLSLLIEENNVKIEYSDLPTVKADPSQMVQVFQNIISNAIKYSYPDRTPEITIKSEKKDDCWLISIKDNGIGIKEEDYDKVFFIFKRLVNNSDIKGAGIGLSICKKIIENYGGKIWIESEENKGTTFFFTIPF